MRTITFYSYKGGVGRTLALSHVAKYLALLGQRVFAIDLDLEAPGLQYKWRSRPQAPAGGLVDLMSVALRDGAFPKDINPYTAIINSESDKGSRLGGQIQIMPAGSAPGPDYWKTLTSLRWERLFFSSNYEASPGIALFLDLKQKIQQDLRPDFLLIDARTGITEIGELAISAMADDLVCFVAFNDESLEGTRAVVQSVARAKRLDGADPVRIFLVVSRIPPDLPVAVQDGIVSRAMEAVVGGTNLRLGADRVFILHSDPKLQVDEHRINLAGSSSRGEDAALESDYLRLFPALVPRELVENQIEPLLDSSYRRALDDPDGVQIELEQLASLYPNGTTFRALLRFYRLRRVSPEDVIKAAERLFNVTGDASEPILYEVVRSYFREQRRTRTVPASLTFLKSVWRAQGTEDPQLGLRLARLFVTEADREGALSVMREVLQRLNRSDPSTLAAVGILLDAGAQTEASAVLEEAGPSLGNLPEFRVLQAREVAESGNSDRAKGFLATPGFDLRYLQAESPQTWSRLMILAGNTVELTPDVEADTERTLHLLASEDTPSALVIDRLRGVAAAYDAADRFDELQAKVRHALRRVRRDRRVTEFVEAELSRMRTRRPEGKRRITGPLSVT